MEIGETLERWHRFAESGDVALLTDILADEVVFHAPTYWTPRRGRLEVALVLGTVVGVFEDFRYEREWVDGRNWALEFTTRVGDLRLKGVDLIRLDDEGRIVDFEVVARPPNAVLALRDAMAERLQAFVESGAGAQAD